MNLNVTDWKPFLLKNICKITMGNKMDFVNMTFENPSIAFVGRSDKNNGVANIVDIVIDDKGNTVKPYKAGCITVALGGTLGASFIQTKDFYTSQNVSVLEFEDCVSNDAKLFITSSIMNECKYKYFPFGRELNTHIRTDFGFNLPVQHNADGSIFIDNTKKYSDNGYVPDWQFMEDYIKSLHHKPLTTKNKSGQAPVLNEQDWKEFYLTDLFGDCERGTRITTDARFEGNIPFCTAKGVNEGISELIGNSEGKTYKNALSINVFGDCFYHGYDFKCDDDVLVMTNEHINIYTGLFLSRIISIDKYRNNYGRQYGQKNYVRHKIKLPVDKKGNPDWQFMENYIKALPYGDRLEG